MKILYRYIFFKLWGPFLFGLMGTTLIIALDPMQKALDYIFKNKIDPAIILEWFLCSIPKDMLFIFPTASLLAGLLVFAELSKNSELVAIRAGGISFFTTLRPVWLFAVLVFCIVLYVQDRVVPPALKKRQEIFRIHIKQHQPERFRKNVVLRIGEDKLLHIGKMDVNTGEIFQVLLYSGQQQILTALRGTLKEGQIWTLYDGIFSEWAMEQPGNSESLNRRFKTHNVELGLTSRDLSNYEVKRRQEMSYRELMDLIRYHDSRGVLSTTPLWVDFYSKTAFPFASIIFCVLGAALGLSPARGGSFVGFGISLVLSFVYFLIMGFCIPFGKNALITPFLAGWTQNIVFLVVTAYVLWRSQQS